MPTKTVDILEEQPSLSELLAMSMAGNDVIIAEGNRPLARLVRVNQQTAKRIPGLHSGAIWTSDDFDEPLPDQFWIGTT